MRGGDWCGGRRGYTRGARMKMKERKKEGKKEEGRRKIVGREGGRRDLVVVGALVLKSQSELRDEHVDLDRSSL